MPGCEYAVAPRLNHPQWRSHEVPAAQGGAQCNPGFRITPKTTLAPNGAL